jgi:hypothetical protein
VYRHFQAARARKAHIRDAFHPRGTRRREECRRIRGEPLAASRATEQILDALVRVPVWTLWRDGHSAHRILRYGRSHAEKLRVFGPAVDPVCSPQIEGYTRLMNFDALPGGDFIRQGLDDLKAGRETDASLLVQIGAHRLRRLGIDIPTPTAPAQDSLVEHRLYMRLAEKDQDGAHSRYNALLRTLVSFVRAAECAS